MGLAVVFDMDGVILDTEVMCLRCWTEVAGEYGISQIQHLFEQCIGTTHAKTKEIVSHAMGGERVYEEFERKTSALFREIERLEGIPLKKGVREVLEFLKAQNAKIALASSTQYSAVSRELEQAGVIHYFQEIVTGDMVTHSKPDPEIFRKACEKLGVEPKEAYAIEDSFNGVRSASDAGLRTIMVPDIIKPDDEMRTRTEIILNDLIEVKEYFQCLN
ncbi:MAG TPA: HAD family phosphatase [Candidatus Pelethocola excrementipullorum]|nr:HAD family phosphatase [Candidatus Pelethocola excrementipullorum]